MEFSVVFLMLLMLRCFCPVTTGKWLDKQMTTRVQVQIYESDWWRFERYELKSGKIRPARNANGGRYEPWKMYESSKVETKGISPYAELLTLLNFLKLAPPSNYKGICEFFAHEELIERARLTEEHEQAILDWCAKWGLLGLLSHKTSLIHLAPRLCANNKVTQSSYQRSNGAWNEDTGEWHFSTAADASSSYHQRVPYALVTFEDEGGAPMSEQSIERAVWPYFPSVPRKRALKFQYHEPLSDEFWHGYAEPLTEFLLFAQRLALAIQRISPTFLAENARRERRFDASSPKPGDEMDFLPTCQDMEPLIAPVGQSVSFTDDRSKVQLRWKTPSLLSCFAQMALQDALWGTRVEMCPACHRAFTTTSYQAIYCSENCAWRERKRKARTPKDKSK
jgi:hypothetical protein